MFPAADSSGYFPSKNMSWQPNARTVLTEMAVGGGNYVLSTSTTYSEVEIYQPATATLTIAAAASVTFPAPGAPGIVHRFIASGDVQASVGVANCMLVKTGMGQISGTGNSR